MPNIEIPYTPRNAFLPYHAHTKRFAATVAHRRAGKTVARINQMLRAAIRHSRKQPAGRYCYLAPTLSQAKRTAWDYLKFYAGPLLELGGTKNEGDLFIRLPHNNAEIRLYGAENAEPLRGGYIDGIIIDEAQGIGRSVLTTIILPQLSDYKGYLDISGTSKGWENLLGEMIKIARENQDTWFTQTLRASETDILDPVELKQWQQLMSQNEYAQEFECDFDAAITGAVYGIQMADAQAQGRIKELLPIPGLDVHTAWDMGYRDATAIWFWQELPGEVHLIDYFEVHFKDIQEICQFIKARGYRLGKHYVPPDAFFELQAAGGRSMAQQAWEAGIQFSPPIPETSASNYIEAVRMTLPRCWFDAEKCKDGIAALKQFQFERIEGKQTYADKPRHDWTSHGARAFDIIARVWQEPKQEPKPQKPRFLHEIEANEVFWPTKKHADAGDRI